jgi:hypothetical protein
MKFTSIESRDAAIKMACVELGKAYGELKLREHLLTEAKQSYVDGAMKAGAEVVTETTAQVVEVVAEPVSTPKAKKEPKPKVTKAEVVESKGYVIPGEDLDSVPEIPVQAVKPEDLPSVDVEIPADACPISNTGDLRNYMFKRYAELGKSNEALTAIKAALLKATGVNEAAKVPDAKLSAAYEAIKETVV